jgi:hypothetical protein
MNTFKTSTGYSIALINWRFEYKGKHENLFSSVKISS